MDGVANRAITVTIPARLELGPEVEERYEFFLTKASIRRHASSQASFHCS